ncbi:hypothetical protein G6L41_008870 [Agrobacterium tumefaciens]|uniref:hypothetical protein n=1 Tax=Agrobacterium tumefaciens TaxID=358 RepID=UPI001574B66A|nr:hypothetical protein [Agrobacterium tumefaciens]WCK12380.1 hypothetical protein G6L41_008870 [Agrobacterium tumefaciens]
MPSFSLILHSLFEIILTMAFVHLPILLGLVFQAVGKDGMTPELALKMFFADYSYGDILGYSAGILASSTVWFVLNIKMFKNRPGWGAALIVFPFLILMFAAPVFFREQVGEVGNNEFAATYVQLILLLAFLTWWVSLYQQRVLPELNSGGAREVQKIKNDLEQRRS